MKRLAGIVILTYVLALVIKHSLVAVGIYSGFLSFVLAVAAAFGLMHLLDLRKY